MSDVSIVCRGLWKATVTIGLVLMLGQTLAEGAAARPAKDASERGKAVAAAARYLQGQGFTDPMLAAENVDNSQLNVELDNRGWARMNKNQKMEFLDKVNGAVLSADGGVAIDVRVSMNGNKVADSTFSAGQQVMRLLE
jgi:hypothetical protein